MKEKRKKKATPGRFLSGLLALIMVLAMLPLSGFEAVTVCAEETYVTASISKVVAGSQEVLAETGLATNVLDGDTSTIWHTQYSSGTDTESYDNHYLIFELSETSAVTGLRYLPRQGTRIGDSNGIITQYEIYVSTDGSSYTKATEGTWASDQEWKTASFTAQTAKYVKFVSKASTSELSKYYSSAAEIEILISGGSSDSQEVVLSNPRSEHIAGDASKISSPRISGSTVTYDYVWFGSYPQAEVVTSDMKKNFTAVPEEVIRKGDLVVSDSLYASLQSASGWDSKNEITLDGTKYRRMRQGDSSDGLYGTYDWADATTWHYFRYEPIKWRVLKKEGSQALLLAEDALDAQYYHGDKSVNISWSGSRIRDWLNGYGDFSDSSSKWNFIDSAFTSAEQGALIGSTPVRLLTLSEASTASYGFLNSSNVTDDYRCCQSTMYEKAMGSYVLDQELDSQLTNYEEKHIGNVEWWLSDTVFDSYACAYIGEWHGKTTAKYIVSAAYSVRPVVTLDLTATEQYSNKTGYSAYSPNQVTWDTVWFGSYPQAEVITAAMNSNYTALDARLLEDGDLLVSDSLYAALQAASGWDANNEITLDGAKYRRMKKGDASRIDEYNEGDYNWSDATTWHYFKYEPIKWRVLQTNGSQATLLADVALTSSNYHSVDENVTWETCTLRSWLNQDFFSEAFNAREQGAVVNTLLENPDNITYGTESGNNTTDKVFLLSESEVWNTEKAKAFGLAENYYARIVRSSTYARAMGTYDGYWVLRTPGNTQKVVTYIWNNLVLDNMK